MIRLASGGDIIFGKGEVTVEPINPSMAVEWAVAAIVSFGAALIALRYFKLSPLWALIIGMAIFTGLQFPITTHVTLLKPRHSN